MIDFIKTNFVGKNMVIAACGVEHEEFTQMISPLFSSLPSVGAKPIHYAPPVYTGGDFYHEMPNPEGFIHLAVVIFFIIFYSFFVLKVKKFFIKNFF